MALANLESIHLPKPSLPFKRDMREGLVRSQSEYLPAPKLTDLPRPSPPNFTAPSCPLTPAESSRSMSISPERYRSTPPISSAINNGRTRSSSEVRYDHLAKDRQLPLPMIPGSAPKSAGRLPLPSLAIKIPYAPPSPSPLSGSRYHKSTAEITPPPLGRVPRPSLPKRGIAPLYDAIGDYKGDLTLPNPLHARRPSRGCGSNLARLLHGNTVGDEWRNEDNMVL